MVVRLRHGKKADLNAYVLQALGRAFSLTGVAATFKKAWRLTVPDKIPYILTGQSATLGPPVAQAVASDWASRITAPGVVWYHKFDSATEMNRFRWTNGVGSGNNPNGDLGSSPGHMAWNATGGPDNGPYISFYHEPTGAGSAQKWCRPFSPMDGTSNGRGSADPAYGGLIPLQTFTPTPGGDQTVSYSNRSNPGYYGKPEYQAAGGYNAPSYPQTAKTFDGLDFYFQIRVKMDPAAMTYGTPKPNGKFFFLTTTTTVTNCNQEVVTVTRWPTPTVAGPSQPNYHTMYEGGFSQLDNGNGTVAADSSYVDKIWNPPVNSNNSTYGTGKIGWSYSGGWDTLMYHVTPGTNNGNSGGSIKDTRIEVWAAHEGETSYTKIWDTKYAAFFEDMQQFTPGMLKYGWNAITLANYQNIDLGDTVAAPHYQSFGQIIFSKQTIPCPQPATALESLAATMAAGSWAELVTNNFLSPIDMLEPNYVLYSGSTSPLTEFGDRMVYNPIQKAIYFIGGARGYQDPAYELDTTSYPDAGMIKYDEATNTWTRVYGINVWAGPHSYEQQDVDPATGDFYYFENSQEFYFGAKLRKWVGADFSSPSTITYGPSSTGGVFTGAIAWFPEFNGGQGAMIVIDGGNAAQGSPPSYQPRIWYLLKGSSTWQQILLSSSFPIGGYSCFAAYSRQHQCVYFGGGVSSPAFYGGDPTRVLCKLSSTGTVTRMTDAPAAVSLGVFGASGKQCVDPSSGSLLTFNSSISSDGRVWSFNGSSWAQHGAHNLAPGPRELLAVMCPHPAGVVVVANYARSSSKIWLYKHS